MAALEILVHFSVLPKDFVLTEIRIPDEVGIQRIESSQLPARWEHETTFDATRAIGEQWSQEGRYAVLSIPSTIIPEERNFVINPAHPDFRIIEFTAPSPFRFDSRLK